MCGILAILGSTLPPSELRQRALELSARLRHRGPDWNGICVQTYKQQDRQFVNVLAHERLAIVGLDSGAQPLYNDSKTSALTVNGEIYNHKVLRTKLKKEHTFRTHSDCEVIVHLYEDFGDEFVDLLDGKFSFVVSTVNENSSSFLAARDPIGVTSLYIGYGRDGSFWFASELKALKDDCERVEEFPPGHYWSSKNGEFRRYYNPAWISEQIPTGKLSLELLAQSLERAVVKRLMTDVPYGVLLSGGLDSSLIAAIAARHAAMRVEQNEQSAAWWPRLHSFSIGLEGSPDLKAAKQVADFLGTVHHEFTFTVEEGIDALSDVIYHIETYDITSIRASTPMYFLARRIKAMGVKMVLSGEGSDEIFGGYLYFHKAPSPEKFHVELCHKLKLLSKYDCLRANKSTAAWGVEARCPFLDREFLDVALAIDPSEKMIRNGRIEKYILRKAFDNKEKPWLPESILWRQKEQFSDGVGYSWIDSLKLHAEREVTDEQLKNAQHRFPINTPMTKEGYLYRSLFHKRFPSESAAKTVPGGPTVACSTPAAIEWDLAWKNNLDPSGRAALGVHENALKDTKSEQKQ